jgi:polar amino acid transport system substrate-binding protein
MKPRLWQRVLAGAIVLMAAFATPASAQDAMSSIKHRGKLIVGVKNDYKPWGFVDLSGQLAGLEIDLARDVADRLGVGLELVPVVASNRLEFLQQGRIDLIIATLTDTPQRRNVVGMIEPHYYAGGVNILTKRSAGFTDWAQLRDRTVCAVQGAYSNRRVYELYGPKLVVFAGVPEAFNALQQGNCVAFFFDSTLIESTLAGGDPTWAGYAMPLKTEDEQPWAVAVRREELQGPWGDFMRKVTEDWHRSGKLLALEKKCGISESPFLREMNKKYTKS